MYTDALRNLSGNWVQTTTILILGVAAGTLYLFQRDLPVERPEDRPATGMHAVLPDIPAWADPIEEVGKRYVAECTRVQRGILINESEKREQQNCDRGPAKATFDQLIKDRSPLRTTRCTLETRSLGRCVGIHDRFVPVLIPGTFDQLHHETRLRIRYAINASLTQLGYSPRSLDWFLIDSRKTKWSERDRRLTLGDAMAVPFEVFEKVSDNTSENFGSSAQPLQRIVLLWLSEQELNEKIVDREGDLIDGSSRVLAQIEAALQEPDLVEKTGSRLCEGGVSGSSCVVIGPSDSGWLIRMLRRSMRVSVSKQSKNNQSRTIIEELDNSANENQYTTGAENWMDDSLWRWLLNSLSDYLDFGTGPQHNWIIGDADSNSLNLRQCLNEKDPNNPDDIEKCFQQLNLEDTNREWERWIAERLIFRQQLLQLRSNGAQLGVDWVDVFILANEFLDTPLHVSTIESWIMDAPGCASDSPSPQAWINANEITEKRIWLQACLNEINHVDSYPGWERVIATRQQISQILEVHDLNPAQWGDWLHSIDRYLDNGLTAEALANEDAWKCIKRIEYEPESEELSDCLEQLQIDDSNSDWETIAARGFQQPLRMRELITAFFPAPDQSSERLLMLLAHRYLDAGILDNIQNLTTALISCDDYRQPNQDAYDGDKLIACLAEAEISDSDPNWEATVVKEFLENVDGSGQKAAEDAEESTDNVAHQRDAFKSIKPLIDSPELTNAANRIRQSLHLISPRATMPEKALQKAAGIEKRDADWIRSGLGVKTFERTIASDERLVGHLITKLSARGIKRPEQIALVHEGGNPYAEEFAEMIKRAFEADENAKDIKCPCTLISEEQNSIIGNVRRFSYSSKLDGVLPGNDTVAQAGDLLSRLAGVGQNPTEQPRMAHQLDYLRRLAKQIRQSSRQIQAANDQNLGEDTGILAVGVITPDIYDKRLILRAMRSELPETVFFTTDLDAALLDQAEFPWLRNLLVASAFPLAISTSVGKTPSKSVRTEYNIQPAPFRDSYQTSYQLAIPLLLGSSDEPIDEMNEEEVGTHLFEIGKSGPIRLAEENSDQDIWRCGYDAKSDCDFGLIPGYGTVLAQVIYFLLLVFPTVFFFILGWKRWKVLKEVAGRSKFTEKHLEWSRIIAFLGVALLLVGYYWVTRSEPMLLFEGVSAVPGIMLRFQVFWFGGLLLLLAMIIQRVYVHHTLIEAGLGPKNDQDHSKKSTIDSELKKSSWAANQWSEFKEFAKSYKAIPSHDFDFPDYCPKSRSIYTDEHLDVEREHFIKSWDNYRRACLMRPALILAFLLAILGAALFFIFGDLHSFKPFVHKSIGFWLIYFLTYAGLVSTLTAVFYALYEFTVLKRWIMHLSFNEPLLPPNANVLRGVSGPGANLIGLLRVVGYISQMGYRTMLVPIILLFLYALSYARLFEGWPWPSALTFLLVVSAAILFWVTFSLLQAASAMRRRFLMKARYSGFAEDKSDPDALQAAILGVSQGVFRPTWQNPTIGLVLIQILFGIVIWFLAGAYM